MNIVKKSGKTYISNNLNYAYLDSYKKNIKNPFCLEVFESDIELGVELEFYIPVESKANLNEELNEKVTRVVSGLSFFNEKICIVPNLKEEEKELDTAYLERDDSLLGSDEGFELVSPLLNTKEIAFYYQTASELLNDIGYSNNDTGVHFHISSPSFDKVDMFKLMTFLHADENLFYGYKDRNAYVKSLETVFLNSEKDTFNECVKNTTKRFDLIQVDTHNHIELRIFGGDGIYSSPEKVLEKLNDFLKIYRIACHEDMEVELYNDLVVKNLNSGHHQNKPLEFDALEQMVLNYKKENLCSLPKAFNTVFEQQEKEHLVDQNFVDQFEEKYFMDAN